MQLSDNSLASLRMLLLRFRTVGYFETLPVGYHTLLARWQSGLASSIDLRLPRFEIRMAIPRIVRQEYFNETAEKKVHF